MTTKDSDIRRLQADLDYTRDEVNHRDLIIKRKDDMIAVLQAQYSSLVEHSAKLLMKRPVITVLPAGAVEGLKGAKPARVVRHKKRGSTYAVIGVGRMQADDWCEYGGDSAPNPSVDMHEVVVYMSIADGSIWVRPREKFEDGRFEDVEPDGKVTP